MYAEGKAAAKGRIVPMVYGDEKLHEAIES